MKIVKTGQFTQRTGWSAPIPSVTRRRFLGGLCHPLPSTILFAYRYEWIVQAIILLTYILLNFVGSAPGCDRC